MGLEEKDFEDDVIFEGEEVPQQGIKWMALMKVHTSNQFTRSTFYANMTAAWSLT